MAGLRGGYWIKNINWLGGAADINYFKAESRNSNAEVSLVSFSLMLMLRYPLLINADFPNGRFYPYAGLGASAVSVEISSMVTSSSDGDSDTSSYGMLFCTGATWLFSRHVGLFIEYRVVSVSFEESGTWHRTDLFGHRDYFSYEAEGDVQAHQFLGGVAVRF
jgi:opacity protein-like surface antigen